MLMNRALQCPREEGKQHHCSSVHWGMEWLSEDSTIKFRWWFLPFCWYLEPFSTQQWCRKGRQVAHSCWLHPQEHQGPGCAQDWTPAAPGPSYPWAELAPWLHTLASAHTLTLPFLTKICHTKCCDPSSTVPNMLLPGSSAQCILPALCLLASALPALTLMCSF